MRVLFDFSTIIVPILQIIAPALVTIFSAFLLPVYIPRLTARKQNLRKLYSISITFRNFFTSDLLIRLDQKNRRRDFLISMFFTAVGYLILISSYQIVSSYYISMGFLVLFVTFIPPYLEMFLVSRYKNEEDKSMIEYLIAKNEKILLLIQIYSLAVMVILIAIHQPSSFFAAAIGSITGLFVILIIRIRDYSSLNFVYDRVFKARFKSTLYVAIITKNEKLSGKVLSIGDYLIIENKKHTIWPVDWHSIVSLALTKEIKQD